MHVKAGRNGDGCREAISRGEALAVFGITHRGRLKGVGIDCFEGREKRAKDSKKEA